MRPRASWRAGADVCSWGGLHLLDKHPTSQRVGLTTAKPARLPEAPGNRYLSGPMRSGLLFNAVILRSKMLNGLHRIITWRNLDRVTASHYDAGRGVGQDQKTSFVEME